MMQSSWVAIIRRVNAAVIIVSTVLMAAMVALVTANVFWRYVFADSLTWSSEMARYLMVWSTMLAAAVLVGRGEHLAVDLLERRLDPRQKRWLNVMISVLSLTFFAVVVVSGVMLVSGTIGQMAPSMEWLPMSAVFVILPLSALLMFVNCADRLRRELDAGEPAS
jgi:TRAP-type C4-dicarboxylate transport system permease small subunit